MGTIKHSYVVCHNAMPSNSLPYDQLQQRLKEIDTNGHHSYIELTKIPILDWFKTYTKDDLFNDVIAVERVRD